MTTYVPSSVMGILTHPLYPYYSRQGLLSSTVRGIAGRRRSGQYARTLEASADYTPQSINIVKGTS